MSSTDAGFVHPEAAVEDGAHVGASTRVWDLARIRAGARVGSGCSVGRGAFIDAGVVVGDRCKIQNNALLYGPAHLADGVFVGPAAVLTNDRRPRAVRPDGTATTTDDWLAQGVRVGLGASVGAAATIVAGVNVGAWALIGAGSVVAADVPAFALVVGVPARRIGWVGPAGHRLNSDGHEWRCPVTEARFVERHGVLEPA